MTGKKNKDNVTQLKNFKEKSVQVCFKSEIPLFENKCTIECSIANQEVTETFDYNNYIHDDGELAVTELNSVFNKILSKLN